MILEVRFLVSVKRKPDWFLTLEIETKRGLVKLIRINKIMLTLFKKCMMMKSKILKIMTS
jgi:hypothetical protein